jgi:hypothetical protein
MVLLMTPSYGQEVSGIPGVYPEGVSIRYGLGMYAFKDEYISGEKYSGSMPTFTVQWVRAHPKAVYRLALAYRGSDEITNHNVSTAVTHFTLSQGFLYPLKSISLFRKPLYAWRGPSTAIFFFNNDPDIAVSGFDYAQSVAALISVGLNADLIYPLTSRFQCESALRFTVLSMGLREIDAEETDDAPVKLLTLLNGLHVSFDLGCRFVLFKPFSVRAAYRFEFVRMGAWEPLLIASDNVLIDLTVRF